MDLTAEERESDSPFVERVWHSQSERSSPFTSVANMHWGMVVTRYKGSTTLTVRGPETKASSAFCPEDGEWFGIDFKPGTLMPHIPPKVVMDRNDVNLPEASRDSFWLYGSAWQLPNFENAETFIDKLVRHGILIHDPLVSAVLQGQAVEMSLRTVQRRFLQATALTHGTVSQINRARYATILLRQGTPILDTVYEAGYADQAHMTRSLKHYIGHTPAQLSTAKIIQPLSLLFKTETF